MRLGMRTTNQFVDSLNQKNKTIADLYLSKMTHLTEMSKTNVMLGDSTVTEQQTFDPKRVWDFFEKINSSLHDVGWSTQNVSETKNADLRRVFTKFETRQGNYIISGHLSLQFHVLLYYKPTQRVMEVQKELSNIVDKTKDRQEGVSDDVDKLALKKLKERGYKDMDHQKLFEIFYQDDKLREEISEEIQRDSDKTFQALSEKKTGLIEELDSLLVETYQTTHLLIDDPRLVSGEEGYLATLDLEHVKNDDTRQGLFDPRKISDATCKGILGQLDELYRALSQ